MIPTLMSALFALGLAQSDGAAKTTNSLDGVWTIVAMEVNGRPSKIDEKDSGLAIRNNTLTLPGIASMHGVIRIELGPKGVLRAIPAARGTGNRRDTSDDPGGAIGEATGVYVRTANHLALTIGDPSTATATGTGVGPDVPATADPPIPGSPPAEKPQPTVGQPPVSLVLKRSTGSDAPPSTAATPPPPAPSTNPLPNTAAPAPGAPAANDSAVNTSTPQRVSTMMGSNVTLSDGTVAGRIDDFVFGDSGTFAVLDNAGTFNAVPFNALSFGATPGVATLPLNRAQFATVPTFGANDVNAFLRDPRFFTRVQNTFIGFRDINGNPVFNSIGMNSLTNRGQNPNQQPMNRTTSQPGNARINQPGNQPNQGAAQPGTVPGAAGTQPGGSKAVPGGTDPNTIQGNPAPPRGQPPPAQPKGQPSTGQPKGTPHAGQPKGQPKGGQPKGTPIPPR
jgi:hypothetical protein